MWKIIQELLPAVLVILFLSQYVIPVLFNKRTWWLFRGETEDLEIKDKPTANPSQLFEEIEATKAVVDEAKAKAEVVQEKVDGNLKEAEDLKKAADKLNKLK